jgi:hypothetical protein
MTFIKKYLIFFVILFLSIFGILEIQSVHNFAEEKFNISFSPGDIFGGTLPDDAVEIVTSKSKFKIGEEIFFGVQNKTDKTLRVENECPFEPLEVYYWNGEIWKHLKATASNVHCQKSGDITIEPYELKGSSFLPWSNIIFNTPGKYRLEIEIIGYKNNFQTEIEIIE